ncbi:MAG: GNAT family N-acetyltransferase [Chitinophagaceae bacterium]
MIRNAEKDDAVKIAELLDLSFLNYKHLYTIKGYQATTPGPETILKRIGEGMCWVYESKSDIAGTLSSKLTSKGLYLYGMAVHPGYRNQKIGWSLLKEAELFAIKKDIGNMYLSTTPFLYKAIKLYEQFGFLKTQEPPFDLYGTPLFTMEKTLT